MGRVIKDQLLRYRVDHLHYMSHIDNVPSILAHGIMSYNKVHCESIPHRSIAWSSVQRHRRKEFVPLYFATHTPMQYVKTQTTQRCGTPSMEQRELVFMEVDAARIFRRHGVLFTDGNAASNETTFFSELSDMDKLDWNVIHTRNCYSKEYKRLKAAEVLVPDIVPFKYFKRVVAYDAEVSRELRKMSKKLQKELERTRPRKDWSHLQAYSFTVDKSHYY